ncbi:MAG: 1-acyl-sn-glycerol-3-phosphate acyltransferase [Clostridiales bacterium]|nr:1-acyl-sn-glycerol-3-phosphate acyltransferase [Clostridiales bacterium]
MSMWFYDFLLPVARAFFWLLYPLRVSGAENIPKEGGFVLCANHVHALDPFALAAACHGRRLRFLAKAELFQKPLSAKFFSGIGAFPVRRGETDLGAIRQSIKILSDGHALGIFPQGTRSRENDRTHMETGVALIALRSGKSVVPAYIDGPYRLFKRTRVVLGKPVGLSDLGRKFDREALSQATARIEEAIWKLK